MKYEKAYTPIVISIAVVVAAIAAVLVMNNRAAVARAKAAEAESLEVAAEKRLKEAKANEAAAVARSAAAKAEQKKAEAESETAIANQKEREAEAKASSAAAERAKAEAETSRNSAEAVRELREVEQRKAESAKAELERQRERLAAEIALSNAAVAEVATRLEIEKRNTEAIIAEAKARELRKLDFEQIERELIEIRQDLDERARALRPDVSIFDSTNVTWVAEREADTIGGETNLFLRVVKVLPENDPRLSPATRALARIDRQNHESATNRVGTAKAKLIVTLERMRDEACREGRVADANFFQKSIKALYPDYRQ